MVSLVYSGGAEVSGNVRQPVGAHKSDSGGLARDGENSSMTAPVGYSAEEIAELRRWHPPPTWPVVR